MSYTDNTKTVTPIQVNELSRLQQGYDLHDYIVNGFSDGFDVGWTGSSFVQCTKYAQIVESNPHLVEPLILKEINARRVAGPFPYPPF